MVTNYTPPTPRYEAALAALKRMAASATLPIGRRANAEQEFGQAYTEMVQRGMRPKLRGKYRLGR